MRFAVETRGSFGPRGLRFKGFLRIFGSASPIASRLDTARLLQSGKSMVRKLVISTPDFSARSRSVKQPDAMRWRTISSSRFVSFMALTIRPRCVRCKRGGVTSAPGVYKNTLHYEIVGHTNCEPRPVPPTQGQGLGPARWTQGAGPKGEGWTSRS